MTQKCLKATELCLSGLASGKRMFYMKYLSICYFWTMSVVKHSDQVDLIVVPHQPACGDVSVYCYWILVQLLLQPPDWGAAKKKAIHSSPEPTGSACSTVHQSHLRSVCVWMCFLYFTLVRNRAVSQLHTDPLHRSNFYRNTFRTDFPAVPRWTWSFSLTLTDFFAAQVNVKSRIQKACEVGYTSIICTCTGHI